MRRTLLVAHRRPKTLVLVGVLSGMLLFGTGLAKRVEYRVQFGDTAASVARAAGMSVGALLAGNRLSNPTLTVGQVLMLDVPEAYAPSATALALAAAPLPGAPLSDAPLSGAPLSDTGAPPSPASTSVVGAAPLSYTVAPGDTLYSIARRVGAKVDDLLALNHLTSPDLAVGQVLALPAPLAPLPVSPLPGAANTSGAARSLHDLALSFLGVPYRFGWASLAATDCSGLALQVFAALGVTLPRNSADQFRVGLPVDRAALQEGDLVFFETSDRQEVTHVGIVLDADHFVHADSYDGRVTVSSLGEKYYASRYVGARRVLPPLAVTPETPR